MTKILGISAFYHDSAACLLIDGKITAAAQEERFTRKKHDPSYPKNAINFVLNFSGIKLSEVDQIVFFEKPFLKFERLLETYVAFAPKGFLSFSKAMPLWIKEKLFQKNLLFNKLKEHDEDYKSDKNIFFSDHHLSHASSAFFPSPFNEAIILTADGVGEWATTTVAIGKGNNLEIKKEIHFPHSLGLLYSAFTYFTGFKVNSGEYKLMGLAPYGNPIYEDKIYKIIDVKNDGTFRLDQSYFNYATGLTMTSKKFHILFDSEPRNPLKDKLTQFHMDIAASIQKVTENIMIKLLKSLKIEYGINNLCMAGGVALNCVANGKILEEKIFDKIWIQPAAGDAGGALGAALALWHLEFNKSREINPNDSMHGSYLGPEFSQDQIEIHLREIGANFEVLEYENLIEVTADLLSKEKAIGWFQGRMEFGPRALGCRSILGDPRSEATQKNLNLKVKYRESFRPFAPSILKEDLNNWFDINIDSPYMLLVSHIKKDKKIEMTEEQKKLFGIDKLNIKRSEIPAVTHVDYSARIQTIDKKNNRKYFDLVTKFKEKTGCPVLVNTSFNVRGEPIVNTPLDAFNCFMGTELDYLVIGNCILDKSKQNLNLKKNYKEKFELD
ncbi:carbamoyltransferase family protein [Candidatus Pelagibacter sp. HIMB1709]|uniref:carbamoyltransferase family protein n=1 Tax=Candidatus Pelagibacter sp. HIMB1709 TaxID=3413367 RepID=UPI003F87F4F0